LIRAHKPHSQQYLVKANSQAWRRAGVFVELELEAEHVRQVGVFNISIRFNPINLNRNPKTRRGIRSPSRPLLVVWPRDGAFDAGEDVFRSALGLCSVS